MGERPRIEAKRAARCSREVCPGDIVVIPVLHCAVMRMLSKPAAFARSTCAPASFQMGASSTTPMRTFGPATAAGASMSAAATATMSFMKRKAPFSRIRPTELPSTLPAGLLSTIPRSREEDYAVSVAQQTFDHLVTSGLDDVDPDIAALLGKELDRQRGQIELIASENFTWPSVLEAVGSVPTNKYAEGYPGKRYYGGCEVVDEIEQVAIDRAKELFGAEHANVQPHAGAQANMAVYFAMLSPGDRVLGLSLDHGGHLTHGLKVNFSGKLYEFHHYGVSRETMLVDYDEVLAQAKEVRPKLIVCGGSAYPRTVDAERFRAIADEVGAMLMCDMAHFSGLVAAGLHQNPVPHCDFVTSTTHKTLAGPRAGFVLCTEEYASKVDRANFPGMQGGPLMHTIAAKAACFRIAATPAFREYQSQVRANADMLSDTLQ